MVSCGALLLSRLLLAVMYTGPKLKCCEGRRYRGKNTPMNRTENFSFRPSMLHFRGKTKI